jgi:hypothetical protein
MPSSHFTKERQHSSFQQAFQYLSLSANNIFFGKKDVSRKTKKNELIVCHSQPTIHVSTNSTAVSLLTRSVSEMTLSTLSHSSDISINDDILPTPSNSTTTLSASAYPIHLQNNNNTRDGSTMCRISINELGEDKDEPWRLDPTIKYSSKQCEYFFMDRDEKSEDTQHFHLDIERYKSFKAISQVFMAFLEIHMALSALHNGFKSSICTNLTAITSPS